MEVVICVVVGLMLLTGHIPVSRRFLRFDYVKRRDDPSTYSVLMALFAVSAAAIIGEFLADAFPDQAVAVERSISGLWR